MKWGCFEAAAQLCTVFFAALVSVRWRGEADGHDVGQGDWQDRTKCLEKDLKT